MPYSFTFFEPFLVQGCCSNGLSDARSGIARVILNFLDVMYQSFISKLCCCDSFEIHARCCLPTPCSFIAFIALCLSTWSKAFLRSIRAAESWDVPLSCLFCCHQGTECFLGRVAVSHEGCLEGFAFDLPHGHQSKKTHPFSHCCLMSKCSTPISLGTRTAAFVELKIIAPFVQVFCECFCSFC